MDTSSSHDNAEHLRRDRLERLLRRLPARGEQAMRWLLQPGRVVFRSIMGGLLIAGGVLGFLPVLGLWMLPLGIALLAEDFALCRKVCAHMLDWVIKRKPHWLGIEPDETEEDAYLRIRSQIPPHHRTGMDEQANL